MNSTNLFDSVAPQRFNLAPPEMTPARIEALRSVIGGLVWVRWHDPRSISHAPWDSYSWPEDMKPDVGYSVGMSDDLPDQMAILVRPHFVSDLFEDDEGRDQGGIVIPYRSIQAIRTLVADEEKFSSSNVPMATGDNDGETGSDGTTH
ncbi:MAG TPA: hypothetical protein VGU20_11960 [Stellaceae bacterium]|nr:hypothetical protein [Stellaceae bacterium]